MTDDEIMIVVAQSVGWKRVRQHWELNEEMAFLNDSPMHWVEKTLTFDQAGEYERLLAAVSKPRDGSCPPPSYHYSARQRCEAYLRTIGKWRE